MFQNNLVIVARRSGGWTQGFFLETVSLIQANHNKDENSDSGTGDRSQEEAVGIFV